MRFIVIAHFSDGSKNEKEIGSIDVRYSIVEAMRDFAGDILRHPRATYASQPIRYEIIEVTEKFVPSTDMLE